MDYFNTRIETPDLQRLLGDSHTTSKEVNVKDLMRVIPEVSSMIDENRKWHWSLNGMSVDATSSPEDWRRLFGSMAIKGRIKKKA